MLSGRPQSVVFAMARERQHFPGTNHTSLRMCHMRPRPRARIPMYTPTNTLTNAHTHNQLQLDGSEERTADLKRTIKAWRMLPRQHETTIFSPIVVTRRQEEGWGYGRLTGVMMCSLVIHAVRDAHTQHAHARTHI